MRKRRTTGAATLTALKVLPSTPAVWPPASLRRPTRSNRPIRQVGGPPLETYGSGDQYAYLAFNEPGSSAGTHKVAIAGRGGTAILTRS